MSNSKVESEESDVDEVGYSTGEHESEIKSEQELDVKKCAAELRTTWKSCSVPVKEEDLVGKWYGVGWKDHKLSRLYIAKVVRRMLMGRYCQYIKLFTTCF